MSNTKTHFTQPMIFSQEELTKRQEKAKFNYYEGNYDSVSRDFKYPATELHSFTTLEALVDFLTEKALNNQPRFKGYMMRQAVGYYDVRIMKPQAQQDEELSSLLKQVEEEYKAEIENDVMVKTELLASQLYEQSQAKAKKQAEEKERKEREAAMKEAQDYVASLIKEAK